MRWAKATNGKSTDNEELGYVHWAFMKLVMGTGWPPSAWIEVSWKMASAWLCGREPIYFCPRPCSCVSMGMDLSCSERGIFLSFILCTSAWAEPSSTAAAPTRAPFIVTAGNRITLLDK